VFLDGVLLDSMGHSAKTTTVYLIVWNKILAPLLVETAWISVRGAIHSQLN